MLEIASSRIGCAIRRRVDRLEDPIQRARATRRARMTKCARAKRRRRRVRQYACARTGCHNQEIRMSAVPKPILSGPADDADFEETKEWLDALAAVIEREGPERAHYLLDRLVDLSRRSGAHIPFSSNTAYINTIPPQLEE